MRRAVLASLGFGSRVPTTAAGCERAILAVWFGGRGLNLVQVAIAASWGLKDSPLPVLAVSCIVAFGVTTAIILITSARRGGCQSGRLALLDISVICAILLLQPWFTDAADRINSWGGWAYPTAIAVTTGAGMAMSRGHNIALSIAAVTASYLISTMPAAVDDTQRLTVMLNSLVFVAFGGMSFAISGYLRRVAAEGDSARAAAVESGRAAERDRNRLLLHDQETVLRLLSEPQLDPNLVLMLQRQAAAGAVRIRSFLSGDSVPEPGDCSLSASARRAAAHFADLPMTISTDLANDVRLDPLASSAVGQAIATLLHNVRIHADATSVVLHAAGGSDGTWDLSVHDDGQGFDPRTTPRGFGLREQVAGALALHGITTEITSGEGEGTMVALRFSPAVV